MRINPHLAYLYSQEERNQEFTTIKMKDIRAELASLADEKRAVQVARYFQTGPGQYAEGDVFWGIPNAEVRRVAKAWKALSFEDVEALLRDPIHECRFAALLIWVWQYPKASPSQKQAIFDSYLSYLTYINNWDLVDLSARDIVGRHLYDKDRSILFTLAQSPLLWARRVSLIATFYFIKEGEFDTSLALARTLLSDKHPLIHKAIGWVLREIGKRDLDLMEEFLHHHIRELPRTTLRYAIEKLSPSRRQYYLSLC